jgi:epoxyqueuosine reductase
VDTGPVVERAYAAAAGLGAWGKNTCLLHPEHGSWFFLGEIVTDLELAPDAPRTDMCGTCTACLDACPTQAFPAPYRIDARRCISYLTIEHKGSIPRDLRPLIGNRIYGCDVCLGVCPWNKFAQAAAQPELKARADLTAPELAALAALDDAAFRQHFAGSPVKRIGRDRFLRNVLIAIGNSEVTGLKSAAQQHLADPSPLVREAAVWALGRLSSPAEMRALAPRIPDPHAAVAEEWRNALARPASRQG